MHAYLLTIVFGNGFYSSFVTVVFLFQLAQKDIEMEDTISRYESQLEDAKSNISTVVVEQESQNSIIQNMEGVLEEKMTEIEAYPFNA